MAAHMAELKPIEEGIAEAMRRGMPPQSRELDPLIQKHRLWVEGAWARPCTPEAYAGLADVYDHCDFQARYEAIAPGLRYLSAGRHAGLGPPAGPMIRFPGAAAEHSFSSQNLTSIMVLSPSRA